MRKSEYARDELTLTLDHIAPTQKSERINEQVTYKMHWLVLWLGKIQTKGLLTEQPLCLMCNLIIYSKMDDWPLYDWHQRGEQSSSLHLAEQPARAKKTIESVRAQIEDPPHTKRVEQKTCVWIDSLLNARRVSGRRRNHPANPRRDSTQR